MKTRKIRVARSENGDEYQKAEVGKNAPAAILLNVSQEDIDTALCAWNGSIESKHAVIRYMQDHAREKDTAAWLAQEYGGSHSNSLFVVRAGSPEETQLPWPKVQRRLAQHIQEDRFYTEEEQDRFDNIDPIAIREALEERGIVNGQVADPEKLDKHRTRSQTY